MVFPSIAIVGQGCVLPGALDPDALWRAILSGDDLLAPVPEQFWRASSARLLKGLQRGEEGCATDRGGFVSGFEDVFDPHAYRLDPKLLLELDPLIQWICHAGGQALAGAGVDADHRLRARTGAIFGNLSYPTSRLAEFAETAWIGTRGSGPHAPRQTHPLNRFSSGLPAHLLCHALGLGAGSFALDAACASSLYAIKLACDWLHDGRADAMLAGGVNAIDGLTLHAGFTTLGALSPSGRSRPFHAAADGLVPAEGAAFVLLKRLADAEANGDRILGVIRGIGLSNDGRAGGILTPDRAGQERAIKAAYRQAELQPRDISLIECHATGTLVGDATEIASTGGVFTGLRDIPIGALKSNLGHLVTASGAAGLLKLVAAMHHRQIPPTIHLDAPSPTLGASPFRVVTEAEPWQASGPLRAAISSFGFGGNNAHLIVEEWQPPVAATRRVVSPPSAAPRPRIAIVGMAAQVAGGQSLDDFARDLMGAPPSTIEGKATAIELPAHGLGIPPKDLEKTLPQQLLALKVARDALAPFAPIAKERTSVVIGMGCDAEGCRLGLRLRLTDLIPETDQRDAVAPRVDAAMIIGCMPNIPANRIGRLFDVEGPVFTVSAEELSGVRAIQIAVHDLETGAVDLALAGAVDLSVEPVHAAAARIVLAADRHVPGDAACAFVLKREADAIRDGDPIYALLDSDCGHAVVWDAGAVVRARFGHAHAASGALEMMAAAVALNEGVLPHVDGKGTPWLPNGQTRAIHLEMAGLGGAHTDIVLREPAIHAPRVRLTQPDLPDVFVYHGRTLAELHDAVAQDQRAALPLPAGPRLAFVATAAELDSIRRTAVALLFRLRGGATPAAAPEIEFAEDANPGEVAFVFTGAAAAYRGMGAELLAAAPQLTRGLATPQLGRRCGWIYESGRGEGPSAFEQLCGASFLSQIHAEWTLRVLDIAPQAAIGLSSGESNALMALGAWSDFDTMLDEIEHERLYEEHISGTYGAAQTHWAEMGWPGGRWASYAVRAPVAEVEAALKGEDKAYLLIINSPGEVLIGGEAAACRRVIDQLPRADAVPLEEGVICHTPALMPSRDLWYRLHRRETRPLPGVRFYGNAHGEAYAVSSTAVAEALLLQAVRMVDFPQTIRRAWDDGVRIFIEHGPRALCSRWIGETLAGRPHVAIALDAGGGNALRSALKATARLIVAGVPVNLEKMRALLARPQQRETPPAAMQSFPAHWPSFDLSRPAADIATEGHQIMKPPPALAPVLEPLVLQLNSRPTVPAEMSPAVARAQMIVEMHHAMTREHVAYLAQANGMHRTFLTGRARAGLAVLPSTSDSPVPQPSALVAPLENRAPSSIRQTPKPIPASASSPAVRRPRPPQGPSFDRQQLEHLATECISDLFGPQFAAQDIYPRQARMPQPPLLLADRILGIDAEPLSMGTGTIWSETDVTADAWYVHDGHMPAGVCIEAGQADLLLISWLGIDMHARGDRVYRLLGCDLTYHGGLPAVGDTMHYEIQIDGHAAQGDVRLFFFHSDCFIDGAVRMSVRNGQAGFFSDQELAGADGILWTPENGEHTPDGAARLAHSPQLTERRTFSVGDIDAFVEGRPYDCFGPGFEMAAAHKSSPRIPGGQMRFVHDVIEFDPQGGPWQRGHLRARFLISRWDWFFAPHFKNDPCMPGTLMFEGCMQALAIYLAALGFTIGRDGWRFEPVPDQNYQLRCRGQVTPRSKVLVADIYIDEIVDGPEPMIFADVLGTVDGHKAFHGRRLGLRLVPDVPPQMEVKAIAPSASALPAAQAEGVTLDYASLLACALGRPSAAFGPKFGRFDGARRLPRLPGPPYHFMSRVIGLDARMEELRAGSSVESEYDIPSDAWYFAENGSGGTMPWCVLLEAVLQPCGWLASFIGVPLTSEEDLFFRNLDGAATVHRELGREDGTLRTRAKLTSISRMGEMTIVAFEVRAALAGGESVLTMTTAFGFFPARALANQSGIPARAEEMERLRRPSMPTGDDDVDHLALLRPRLASGSLLMLDRVTVIDLHGGPAGLGAAYGEKDVRPGEWFFKAHFFGDPVQPGSLGLEALLQLLKALALAQGLDHDIPTARFESVALDGRINWKFRGQVLPTNKLISSVVEITEVARDGASVTVTATGSLWVDGLKIYEVTGLAIRLRSGEERVALVPDVMRPTEVAQQSLAPSVAQAFQGPSDLPQIGAFWRTVSSLEEWPLADLHLGLIDLLVERVDIESPEVYDRLRGRPVLFIANHQVGIESMLFNVIASAILDMPTLTIAKAEHRTSWMGELTALGQSFPGARQPDPIAYFERQNPQDLIDVLARYKTDGGLATSLMLHADGTRAVSCCTPVAKLSTVFTDLACSLDLPVIPVRFVGGLPADPAPQRLEFPIGFAKQRYVLGAPILPDVLRGMPSPDRARRVVVALNALSPHCDDERPGEPQPELEAAIRRRMAEARVDEARAVAIEVLLRSPARDPLSLAIREALHGRAVTLPAGTLGMWLGRFLSWLGVPSAPNGA
ncbi:MAG TPA: beta-ketoacyl synthase N-terminal-like domain-containing protein [Magnetospirillaceae bacterium]|jgi:PfaB family protein